MYLELMLKRPWISLGLTLSVNFEIFHFIDYFKEEKFYPKILKLSNISIIRCYRETNVFLPSFLSSSITLLIH